MPWIYLVIAVFFEIAATTALKMSEGFSRLTPSVLSLLGYGISFFFLSKTLLVLPLGITYAVWSGLGIAALALIGWVAFNQKLDAAAVLGLTLIVSGVLVIQLLSKTSGH
ncbi:MAG: multidrug efflux SMR transporter [Pseudomonadota bacterium]